MTATKSVTPVVDPMTVRHRSTIVEIDQATSTVMVKPKARKLAEVQAVRATLLPLAFPYQAQVGCEGVLIPAGNGSYSFQPSRRDSHLVNLRPAKPAKAAKVAKAA